MKAWELKYTCEQEPEVVNADQSRDAVYFYAEQEEDDNVPVLNWIQSVCPLKVYAYRRLPFEFDEHLIGLIVDAIRDCVGDYDYADGYDGPVDDETFELDQLTVDAMTPVVERALMQLAPELLNPRFERAPEFDTEYSASEVEALLREERPGWF